MLSLEGEGQMNDRIDFSEGEDEDRLGEDLAYVEGEGRVRLKVKVNSQVASTPNLIAILDLLQS